MTSCCISPARSPLSPLDCCVRAFYHEEALSCEELSCNLSGARAPLSLTGRRPGHEELKPLPHPPTARPPDLPPPHLIFSRSVPISNTRPSTLRPSLPRIDFYRFHPLPGSPYPDFLSYPVPLWRGARCAERCHGRRRRRGGAADQVRGVDGLGWRRESWGGSDGRHGEAPGGACRRWRREAARGGSICCCVLVASAAASGQQHRGKSRERRGWPRQQPPALAPATCSHAEGHGMMGSRTRASGRCGWRWQAARESHGRRQGHLRAPTPTAGD